LGGWGGGGGVGVQKVGEGLGLWGVFPVFFRKRLQVSWLGGWGGTCGGRGGNEQLPGWLLFFGSHIRQFRRRPKVELSVSGSPSGSKESGVEGFLSGRDFAQGGS